MKTLRFMAMLLVVLVFVSTAWAQYTLYGAPEVLRLPETQNRGWAQSSYPTMQGAPAVAPTYPVYGTAAAQPPRLAPAGAPIPQADPDGGAPNVVSSMLAESSACEPCVDATCEPAETTCSVLGEPVCCSPWFASVGWITMGRDKANRVWTSYTTGDLSDQLTNTGDISMDWGNGGEVRFGRRFCGCGCQPWALEAVYWSMKPVNGYLATTSSPSVSTPLDFGYTRIDGTSGEVYYTGSEEHRLWRRNEIHNVELNIIRSNAQGCVPSWNVQWVLGVRFFRFDEDLTFGSVEQGYSWGDDPAAEAFLEDRIKNNLVGVQIGFDARSDCWHRFQLYVSPKVGIYNNFIENKCSFYRGDGAQGYAVDQDGTTIMGYFPVSSTENVFSVLAEIDMGVYWHISQNWSAKIGYRLVTATGMGLADHQLLHYVNDLPEIEYIKSNGDLLLHGAYVGVAYNY